MYKNTCQSSGYNLGVYRFCNLHKGVATVQKVRGQKFWARAFGASFFPTPSFMYLHAITTRKFVFRSGRTHPNSSILCWHKKLFSFQAQIAVQRHYFMVCNVLIFWHAKKWGGQKDTLAPPPQNVGGQMPPLPPRLLRL